MTEHEAIQFVLRHPSAPPLAQILSVLCGMDFRWPGDSGLWPACRARADKLVLKAVADAFLAGARGHDNWENHLPIYLRVVENHHRHSARYICTLPDGRTVWQLSREDSNKKDRYLIADAEDVGDDSEDKESVPARKTVVWRTCWQAPSYWPDWQAATTSNRSGAKVDPCL
jgi:hypothetical protein